MGELFASMEAFTRGAEVLRNLSPAAKADLCLMVDSIAIPIDVKVAHWNFYRQVWSSNAPSVRPPVYPVVVIPEGDHFRTWKIGWHRSMSRAVKCPPGLENFWD
jgi:hypothetical protein